MEEQLSHAKRKHYDPKTYERLLIEFTQLMETVPKLRPERDQWDIEGDWSATGIIHFVDAIHQSHFEKVRDFDCRTIKLVNLGRPAVRVTFYRKHRYWLLKDKNLTITDKVEQIEAYINDLIIKSQILETKLDTMNASKKSEASSKISLYKQQVSIWREILKNPEQYEIAVSNYSRQHFYVTVNYKYRLPSGDYTNEQEHLLNTQQDRLNNITQVRYNILFIDTEEILREHPYQNREIEGFLKGFPIKSEVGKHTIYARIRPEANSLESFQ